MLRPETPQFCTLLQQLMLDDNFFVFALTSLFTLYALNKNIYNLRSILSYMPIHCDRSVKNFCAKNGIQCAQGNKLLIFRIKHGLRENAVPDL